MEELQLEASISPVLYYFPATQLLNSVLVNLKPIVKSQGIPWNQQKVPLWSKFLSGNSQETFFHVFFPTFFFLDLINLFHWLTKIAQSQSKFSDFWLHFLMTEKCCCQNYHRKQTNQNNPPKKKTTPKPHERLSRKLKQSYLNSSKWNIWTFP